MVGRCHSGNREGSRGFYLSVRAGLTGPNLTGAEQLLDSDRRWNPAIEKLSSRSCDADRPEKDRN
jgi:SNF2 family DNA or RNA helicase